MTNPSFIEKTAKNIANFAYEHMAKNPGNMLLLTGTAGWILSSFAQITGIISNKKLSSDEKKFLIPQEAFDAAINILSFFVVTKAFTRLGTKLVDSGKLLKPSLKNSLGDKIADIGKKDFKISELDELKNVSSPVFNKEASEKFFSFYDGASFIFGTIGAIISSNIITPIFRNKMAAQRQKSDIAKDKMQIQNKELSPYAPVMPMQNRFSMTDYRAKIGSSGGQMRI